MSAELAALEAWRDSLPDDHKDKPGAVRAVEVLAIYGPRFTEQATRQEAYEEAVAAAGRARHVAVTLSNLAHDLGLEADRLQKVAFNLKPSEAQS
jgi:hypothetical protein